MQHVRRDSKVVSLLQFLAAQAGYALRKVQSSVGPVDDPALNSIFSCVDCLLLAIRDYIAGDTTSVAVTSIVVPVVIRSRATASIRSLYAHWRDCQVTQTNHHLACSAASAARASSGEDIYRSTRQAHRIAGAAKHDKMFSDKVWRDPKRHELNWPDIPSSAMECSALEEHLFKSHGVVVRNTFLGEATSSAQIRSASAPPSSDPWTCSSDYIGSWMPLPTHAPPPTSQIKMPIDEGEFHSSLVCIKMCV